MIIGAIDAVANECIDEEPDHYFLHYDNCKNLIGIRWKYGSKPAIALMKAARKVGAKWNYELKYWAFPDGVAQSFLNKINKKHPDWPIITNIDRNQNILDGLKYTEIDVDKQAALLVPDPLPALGNYPFFIFPPSRIIKLTTKKKSEWLMLLGDKDIIKGISSVLNEQGARGTEKSEIEATINIKSKIQIKVVGWGIEIICDLHNPLHYLVKPEQKYTWTGMYPYGVKKPIPWDGKIYTTRKHWPDWIEHLSQAGLEWEGDNPADKIHTTIPVERNIPGWYVPAPNTYTYHDYQKRGIEFCASRGMRALIGDEMGVGKTAQAIGAAETVSADQILIICPANARYVWEREITGWGSGGAIQHIANQLDTLIPARWRIATYDQLVAKSDSWVINNERDKKAIIDAIPKLKVPKGKYPYKIILDCFYSTVPLFDDHKKTVQWERTMRRLKGEMVEQLLAAKHTLLIVDEAHRAKNRTSKRSKAIKVLASNIPYTLFLTGTPLRNNEDEAAALLGLLDISAQQALSKNKGYSIQDVKDYLQYFMIRRMKKEVLKELPDKTRQRIDIDQLDPTAMEAYEDAMDYARKLHVRYRNRLGTIDKARTDLGLMKGQGGEVADIIEKCGDGDGDDEVRQEILGAIEKARTHLGLAKVLGGEVADLVEEVVENKECAVVFCAHHKVSDTLHEQLIKSGLKVAVIDGRCPPAERAKRVNDFQDGKLDVFIGGIGSAGEAITLTRSDTVIFVELDWVPAAIQQAEDRIHRLGQKSNCQIIHLIARSADLDVTMIETLESKLRRINQVLGERQSSIVGDNNNIRKVVIDRILTKTAGMREG